MRRLLPAAVAVAASAHLAPRCVLASARPCATLASISSRLEALEARCGSRGDVPDLVEFYAMKSFLPDEAMHIVVAGATAAAVPSGALASGAFPAPTHAPNPSHGHSHGPREPFLAYHRQLPIRLAKLIVQVGGLPCGLYAMSSVRKVHSVLHASFLRLKDAPVPRSAEERQAYSRVLAEVNAAHENVIPAMADGVLELRGELLRHRAHTPLGGHGASGGPAVSDDDELHEELARISRGLDDFNTAFVKFKFLARHLELLGLPAKQRAGCVGAIETAMDLGAVVRQAVGEAHDICQSHYSDAPTVRVNVDGLCATFPHWAEVLHYIVVEIVKNSLRATVDRHMARTAVGFVDCSAMPGIDVTVSSRPSEEYACVCVSDEGGGLAREVVRHALSYTYTSVAKPARGSAATKASAPPTLAAASVASAGGSVGSGDAGRLSHEATPLAGYGYGLPMSRVSARCFGGDLQMVSVEGFGTKVYIHVKKNAFTS